MSVNDIVERELPRVESLIAGRQSGVLAGVLKSTPTLILIAILVFLFQIRDLPERLATQSLDASIEAQQKSAARYVQMVVIDDADYATLFSGRSPLDPPVLSRLLMAIAAAQPRALMVDIDTSAPPFAAMDVPTLPTVWNMDGDALKDGRFSEMRPLGGRRLSSGSVAALALVPHDDREIVRSYRRVYELQDGSVAASPGYALARLLTSQPSPQLMPGSGNDRFLDFRYQFKTSKASDVLADSNSKSWKDLSVFKDRVVVVGGTYRAARDRHATPAGLLYGSQIVAQEAEAELDGTTIPSINRWLSGILMMIGGLVTVGVYRWSSLRVAFLVSLLLVPLLSILSNWILFHRFAEWGAMVPLVCAVIVAELYAKASFYLNFYNKISRAHAQKPPEAEAVKDPEAIPGPS